MRALGRKKTFTIVIVVVVVVLAKDKTRLISYPHLSRAAHLDSERSFFFLPSTTKQGRVHLPQEPQSCSRRSISTS